MSRLTFQELCERLAKRRPTPCRFHGGKKLPTWERCAWCVDGVAKIVCVECREPLPGCSCVVRDLAILNGTPVPGEQLALPRVGARDHP